MSKTNQTNTLETNKEEIVTVLKDLIEVIDSRRQFSNLVRRLEHLLPSEEDELETIDLESLETMFLTGSWGGHIYHEATGVGPTALGLVSLNKILTDTDRFEFISPTSLPEAANLRPKFEEPRPLHMTVEIGSQSASVPTARYLFLIDKTTGTKLVVSYEISRGGLGVHIKSCYEKREEGIALIKELKHSPLFSPLVRGQVIEIDEGGFRVVDVGNPVPPIMGDELRDNLEKNVINLFKKRTEFSKCNMGLKRAIALEGAPGCGKTLLCRWLAAEVRGEVTTIWVTAKSIGSATNISEVFDIARKLSPALVIMEDLDLISGSRSLGNYGSQPLGEMLTQLDGLNRNEQIVLVGTTNKISSLDEALRDRPGRFDRIFEVPRPINEVAEAIAKQALTALNVTEEAIAELNLSSLTTGEYTGAQIVEIVKGGMFEAIHNGTTISNLCIKRSRDSLNEQRKRIANMK